MKRISVKIIWFLFLSILSTAAAFALNPISKIGIISPPTSTCNLNSIIQGISTGNYYWPTDGIEFKIESRCMEETIEDWLKVQMNALDLLGYYKKTTKEKVYINAPKVTMLDGGFKVSLKISGWFKKKTFFGYTSKNYYTEEIQQFVALNIDDWNLIMFPSGIVTHTDFDNVSPYIEGFLDVVSFLTLNTTQTGGTFLALVTGNLPINLREQIIKSTNIIDLYKKITGISDPENKIKTVLDNSSLDFFINSDYVTLKLSSERLYESAKREFRTVVTRASKGAFSEQDADNLFEKIRYPQEPSALSLLKNEGIGNENNNPPIAFPISQLEIDFNQSKFFSPAVSDPDDDPLYFSLQVPPRHGKVIILNNINYKFHYHPELSFTGTDYFEFLVEDPYGSFDIASVRLIVKENQQPIAMPRKLVLDWNQGIAFNPPAYDPDEHPLALSIIEVPRHGLVTVVREGRGLQYFPEFDYEGADKFVYRVDDPYGLFDSATINVSIVRPKHLMVITKTGKGAGTISSNPFSIDCGAYCIEEFPAESVVTLTPVPDTHSVFRGWDGNCKGNGNCTVTINSSKVIIALFDKAPTSFDLSVTKTGSGFGTVTSRFTGINCGSDCTENYTSGSNTQVILKATPDRGSVFRGWNGACSGLDACIVRMKNNKDITATFTIANPMTFIVNNYEDAGPGSLRQAILDANSNPGDDVIEFSSDLAGEITLLSVQLAITDSVTLNGPGANVLDISGNYSTRILKINPGTIGAVDINNLTLKEGNDVTGNGGGAIIIDSGTVTLNRVALINNSANVDSGGGGAIRKFGPGALTISNSTISGNSAIDEFNQGAGGGIKIDQGKGKLTINNSTISGNLAANGGGISLDDGTLTVNNSTIVGNSAFFGGGGIFNGDGTLMLSNSIIAGNTANTEKEIQNFGNLLSLGHNLLGENGNSGITADSILASSDLILTGSLSTVLVPLMDNGGPTATHIPVVNGPTIDAGDNNLLLGGNITDQRGPGFFRVRNGTVDIGAIESFVNTYTITSSANKGGTIAPNGRRSIPEGNTIDFTLTAEAGFILDNVTGSCRGKLQGTTFTTEAITHDCSVTASFTVMQIAAEITSPSHASTLSGSSQVFNFEDPSNIVFSLYVGSTPGDFDLGYYPGLKGANSITVTNLPTDGSSIYLTLYSRGRNIWLTNEYIYSASASAAAFITSPADGSTLSGSEQVFNFNDLHSNVFSLYVGSTPGDFDLGYYPGLKGTNSVTVNNLPTNGSSIYLTLYSRGRNIWLTNEYSYTASANSAAFITFPAHSATLSGSKQNINFNDLTK
jgi:Big-like domain-containing protein/List-Bact-rpt repeat protein